MKDDFTPLAQGQHSSVSNAFVVVARDAETYGELRKVAGNLPELNQDFFKSNLVVAAFLGERRTGGYTVRFTRTPEGIVHVEQMTPPKDALVTQVITYPFAAISIPVSERRSLTLFTGDAWQPMTRTYEVKSGDFTMSGGIAGRKERFPIGGRLEVAREGNLVTLFLGLKSRGGTKVRVLSDVASGALQPDNQITIPNISAGSFVDPPADLLSLHLILSEKETSRLLLTFESIPGSTRDGFNGSGALVAEARRTIPPPKKKAATEDAPQ